MFARPPRIELSMLEPDNPDETQSVDEYVADKLDGIKKTFDIVQKQSKETWITELKNMQSHMANNTKLVQQF